VDENITGVKRSESSFLVGQSTERRQAAYLIDSGFRYGVAHSAWPAQPGTASISYTVELIADSQTTRR